jgi:rhamnose utilization protein RhaD (predicted bifunctional aldolase and dehydrogenase)
MNSPHPDKIASLLKLSLDLGREDRGLAILGEGNTSCRLDAETFLVKASGSSLSNLREDQLVACKFSVLLPLLKVDKISDADMEKTLLASRVDQNAPKPSIEAVFHAYLLSLPGIEVVGHTHPTVINSILCAGDELSQRFANERQFPDAIVFCGAKSVLIPYVDPGIVLSQSIAAATEKFITAGNRPPRVILLQNHGLIALGASPGAVWATTLMSEKSARIFLAASSIGTCTSLTPENVARIDSRPDEHYRQRMLKM